MGVNMYKDKMFLDCSENLINLSSIKESVDLNECISYNEITLNSIDSKKLNKSKGKYITIKFNNKNLDKYLEDLINLIEKSIYKLYSYLNIKKNPKMLFVGLGNKDYACDKFGYKIIEKIDININNYKIYKDVIGKTNISSVEFIKNLLNIVDVDLVIVFDSLMSKDKELLGTTIQLSNTGLSPGSAFGSKVVEINKKTIKKPVINIGIPTIINLQDDNLVVTTNNIDDIVENLSTIISIAINRII